MVNKQDWQTIVRRFVWFGAPYFRPHINTVGIIIIY